jgi:hypothetical protein
MEIAAAERKPGIGRTQEEEKTIDDGLFTKTVSIFGRKNCCGPVH